MPELLVEVGCEELPAHTIRSANRQLLESLERGLQEATLLDGVAEPITSRELCTPRRLIAAIANVKAIQSDRTLERRGPSLKSAYLANGSPSPALLGFCKSLGIEPNHVHVRGNYVWAVLHVRGKPAREILGEIISDSIRSINFDKTMRWGGGRMRFARPIRWIVAVFDREIITFELESVQSSNRSRGHRFLCPEEFEVSDCHSLVEGLRKRYVEPDPEERKARILDSCSTLMKKSIEELKKYPWFCPLVEENVFLTEHPIAIEGTFQKEFLELPREVLITAMSKHERFFPVFDKEENLTNRFISISNGGEADIVRAGNEWVLNARFNDALFFYEEDRRQTLEEFLEKTKNILFQERLGTIYERTERLVGLMRWISEEVFHAREERGPCELAARYCKADLSTGLVSEFPELQGIVGGLYAQREGFPEIAWKAIYHHYEGVPEPKSGGEIAANLLCSVDSAERVAGFLGIGEIPKGSSDPYGIRAAVTKLVELQFYPHFPRISAESIVMKAVELLREGGATLSSDEAIRESFREILLGRYEAMFPEIRYDVRDAVWAVHAADTTPLFLARAQVFQKYINDIPFLRTGKRPANIVDAARKKGIFLPEVPSKEDVSEKLFEHPCEKELLEAAIAAEKEILELEQREDYEGMAKVFRSLQKPIGDFFDQVMVMVDNEKLRDNRLKLLAYLDSLFRKLGDFSRIVIEGESEK